MSRPLTTDLTTIQAAAATSQGEYQAFQMFINLDVELADRRLNTMVQETTDEVWQHIDCRTCANCCRMLHPTFSRTEVQRIAAYLGTTLEELRHRYLTPDAARGKYITQELPCPFLDGNLCSIYEVRPAVCSQYPHLARNFRSRLWQALENAAVCPIVYNVLERLKQRPGFGQRCGRD